MEKSFLRRNLPLLYFPDGKYFITYRLANSLPQEKLTEIEINPTKWDFEKFNRLFTKYDSLLDSGNFNINYLNQRELADICKDTIHYPDGKDYTLICYCIMPNHIHLVFKLLPANKGISKIMQAIKGISANKCNLLLHREGKFWKMKVMIVGLEMIKNCSLLLDMFYLIQLKLD
jgi:REP element-mobilizing transposase RayT